MSQTAHTKFWDFTAPAMMFENELELMEICEKHCTEYVFQRESGEEGYVHYQGRMEMKNRMRLDTLKKRFGKEVHFSPTSRKCQHDYMYVTKSKTRVAGPWGCVTAEACVEMPVKGTETVRPPPRDVAEMKELRPWQQSIVDMAGIYDMRVVDVIIDKKGGIGKTCLRRYMAYKGLALYIPPRNDFRDIARMVMARPIAKCYIIDMPRALSKSELAEFYSGIEYLKGGDAYDDRYKFRSSMFDPPRVVIFTNQHPVMDMLSADRWRLHKVVKDQLVPYKTKDADVPDLPSAGTRGSSTPEEDEVLYSNQVFRDAVDPFDGEKEEVSDDSDLEAELDDIGRDLQKAKKERDEIDRARDAALARLATYRRCEAAREQTYLEALEAMDDPSHPQHGLTPDQREAHLDAICGY